MKSLIESIIIRVELLIGWVFLINKPLHQLTGGSLLFIYKKMAEPKQQIHKNKQKKTEMKQKEECVSFQITIQNGIKESPRKVRAGPASADFLHFNEGGGMLINIKAN